MREMQWRQWMVVMIVAMATATPARAGGVEDFADAVKDATGDYNRSWVLTKLTTFKLGPKCWTKLPDKDNGAIHAATFATRDIVDLAKDWTGDDWSSIETQNNNDRENNKKLIEPMMDAFKKRLFITVNVEGADCDAKRNSLWIRYWSEVTSALKKYPPPAGKAFVTINVASKTRAVTVDVSKDGTTFTINAPKDIEAKYWNESIERPFRQLAAGIPDDLAFLVKEATGDYYTALILTKLVTWKVGKKCYPKLADKDAGVHAATYATRSIATYAKSVGAEDWDEIEGQSSGEPETNRGIVAKDIDAFKKRFSFTVTVDGDDCDASRSSMFLRSWTTVTSALEKYPPKAKKVALTLTLTAKAKDVAVKATKDGSSIAITVPRDIEPTGWSDKIEKAFEKTSAKR